MRFTEDIDILIDDSSGNVSCFLAALADYGEGFARELALEDFDDQEGAIRIFEELEECQIDVFTRISGRKFEDVIVDADWFPLGKWQVAVASKASLIGWKERSVREKDRLDALALRKLEVDPQAFD